MSEQDKPKDSPDAFPDIKLRKERQVSPPKTRPPIPLQFQSYDFNRPRRGLAVIINNHHFDKDRTGQNNRDGTEVDAAELEGVFAMMGFEVRRMDDLRAGQMSVELRRISKEDFNEDDCFVCAILSHGDEGQVYGTDGRVSVTSLLQYFKGDACTSLAGKPKMFFIQACRGRKFDWGVEVADGDDDVDAGPINMRKIPIEADFMVAYSVVPGYFSWRNNVDGSWFVQAIASVFREHYDRQELMKMLTLVNRVVAYDFASCTDDEFTSDMKQVPYITSTLTKEVYFNPKK